MFPVCAMLSLTVFKLEAPDSLSISQRLMMKMTDFVFFPISLMIPENLLKIQFVLQNSKMINESNDILLHITFAHYTMVTIMMILHDGDAK